MTGPIQLNEAMCAVCLFVFVVAVVLVACAS